MTETETDIPQELMKLDWLYYFVVLVEMRNFSLAAKHLYISQQALSKTFAQLEKQLGVQLLIRRPWQLTPEGERLYRQAREILTRANRLEANFRRWPDNELKGPLRLAMLAYFNPALIDTSKRLMRDYPELRLKLMTDFSAAEIEQKLLTQELEMALLPYAPRHKALKSLSYKTAPMLLVASPNLPIPERWQELEFIACHPPSPLDEQLEWPSEHTRKIVLDADLPTAIALAVAGQGALWVPKNAVCRQLRAGSLRTLDFELPFKRQLRFYLVWAASQTHHPLIRQLLEALKPE